MNDQNEVFNYLPVSLHEVHTCIMAQDSDTVRQYEQNSIGILAKDVGWIPQALDAVWPFSAKSEGGLKKLWVLADALADQLIVVADYDQGEQDSVVLNGLSADANAAEFFQIPTQVDQTEGGLQIGSRFDPTQPAAAAHFKGALQQEFQAALRVPTAMFSVGA